ncbi:MAG: hypothetical protein M3360_06345 [Actinomycetota bacterium]|nr:hypothetical protein [Actinomycetota bacterium]
MSQIHADVISEGRRLAGRAADRGLPLRLLGGVAIRLRVPGKVPAIFVRDYGDLDWATAKGTSAVTQRFFEDSGYLPETRFNALNGKDRLMFYDETNERQLDVFVGTFRMSHEIPIQDRLQLDGVTIPLAELVLTKLQIAQLNEKDVKDALTLFHEYPVGDRDDAMINGVHIASLCANDWGLWRTFTANLATCLERLKGYDLPADDITRTAERLTQLEEWTESEPKSRRWRLRARIGERKRWYELPEEVQGGPG